MNIAATVLTTIHYSNYVISIENRPITKLDCLFSVFKVWESWTSDHSL